MEISNKKVFLEAQQLSNKVFDLEKSLPQQVFKEDFSNFTFEEFNWTEDPEFWETSIQTLGHASKDTHIIIMMLDTDLQDFYLHKFNFYTALKLPLTFTGKDYWRELHSGPHKETRDIPYETADKVVWIPLSGKWAIWGERSYETCVLAFNTKELIVPEESLQGTWRPIDKALTDFICLSYYKQQILAEDHAAFLSNYSNTNSTNKKS